MNRGPVRADAFSGDAETATEGVDETGIGRVSLCRVPWAAEWSPRISSIGARTGDERVFSAPSE